MKWEEILWDFYYGAKRKELYLSELCWNNRRKIDQLGFDREKNVLIRRT